ncbi:MAG: enoyl-CoA hydratase/carnithine racemase [Betaproteobacteria bacterium]|nr:enoyl-CoA hydratase/carnithine racemase [Betaproteobacteria bacterium]
MPEDTAMTDTPLYTLSIAEGVALLTLDRPEAHNALNRALRMQLMESFPRLDADDAVKVIVITGAGDKAFCTGADLKERSTQSTQEMIQERHHVMAQWTNALASVSKPVIAAIKGYCMAGGFELVLQSDISIASDNAVFALPEVTHGFFPGGGACQRLPRLVGYQMARELILTGRRCDAQEAKALGLINRVVPLDQVLVEAMAMARKMASYPMTGLVQAKRAINHAMETGLTAGLRYDTEAWIGCMHSEEWRAKLEGFKNKERKA